MPPRDMQIAAAVFIAIAVILVCTPFISLAMAISQMDTKNLIQNGSFETGTFENWTVFGAVGPPQGVQILNSTSHSGQYCAWIPSVFNEGHIQQNITGGALLSGNLIFEAWIRPERIGPMVVEYPFSGIILTFQNITGPSSVYYLYYEWSGYVFSNSSQQDTITLFDWSPNIWNHLQRNLRNDLLSLKNNIDNMSLATVEFAYHLSNNDPGGFLVDDVSLLYKTETSVSIATQTSSAFVGFHVNITGVLCDADDQGITGANITLYFAVPQTENWIPITRIPTNENGTYSATWIPFATGDFILRAEWSGNLTYIGTENRTMLSVIQYESQYVFSVVSNSTLSSLAFNSTSKELMFTANGTSGTSGYAEVTIAKSLVANVADIAVYLDGTQWNYTSRSLDDSWLLYFTYSHSQHEIRVALGSGATSFFESPLAKIALFGSITVLLIALILLLVSRKRRTQS